MIPINSHNDNSCVHIKEDGAFLYGTLDFAICQRKNTTHFSHPKILIALFWKDFHFNLPSEEYRSPNSCLILIFLSSSSSCIQFLVATSFGPWENITHIFYYISYIQYMHIYIYIRQTREQVNFWLCNAFS